MAAETCSNPAYSLGKLSCLLMSVFCLLVKQFPECSASVEVKFAGSCDFETEDLCGYVQSERDDFNWRRRSGPTPSTKTGPDHDHTIGANGTGHYVYIEGTGVHAWNSAHLISPPLAPRPTYCAQFFYHMYGEDTGQLNLHVLDETVIDKPVLLWSMLWEQGNQWLNTSIDVPCENGCKLSFEAKPGNGFWSDIAIDDITVTNGSCFAEGIYAWSFPTTTRLQTEASTKTVSIDPVPMKPVLGSTVNPTLDYDIIEYRYDEHFITIILAVGLTFWSLVFGVIFVLFCFCDKRQNGGRSRRRQFEMDVEHGDPVKPGIQRNNYTEIEEQERDTVDRVDDNGNDKSVIQPDEMENQESDDGSMDSEMYSVPIITTPKPPRGPTPPCGYMSLQQDSLNNNAEYQPLDVREVMA
ncbi:uncharacterized protein [Diadema antillarum]|uniref:uncharacterized protein n=1 Tax=Diadema antillarum TaxID=105358 RepID=UPI003A8905D8